MSSSSKPDLASQAFEKLAAVSNLDDLKRRDAERVHDELNQFIKQNNDAAYKAGEVALRTVILVNGGAAVAVLAFLGTLASKDKVTTAQLASVASSLIWFAAGVAAGLIAMICAYFTNLYDANVASSKTRTWEHPYSLPGPKTAFYTFISFTVHTAAILMGVVSLALFIAGMLDVKSAIILLAK